MDQRWTTNFDSADGVFTGCDPLDLWRGNRQADHHLEGTGPCFRDELDIPERRFKSIVGRYRRGIEHWACCGVRT